MAGLPSLRSSFWSRCGARYGSAFRRGVEYPGFWCLGYWRSIVSAKLTLDGSLGAPFAGRGGAVTALSAADLSFPGKGLGVHLRLPVSPAGEVLSPTPEIFLPTDARAR